MTTGQMAIHCTTERTKENTSRLVTFADHVDEYGKLLQHT
jgi:hypothetical protein